MEGPILAAQSTQYTSKTEVDATEEPAAKRLHKSQPENKPPAWHANFSRLAASQMASEAKAPTADRRRSALRDTKAPLGPRPPEFSRRAPSDSAALTTSSPRRSYFAGATSEPFLGLSARKSSTGFDFSEQSMPAAPVTINSLQPSSTTASAEAPMFGSETETHLTSSLNSLTMNNPAPSESPRKQLSKGPGGSLPRPRQGETSPVRLKNPALRAAQLSTGAASGVSVSTPLAIKTRRQSQLPPSMTAAVDPRQPRKSIGPGLVVTSGNGKERTLGEVAPRSRPLIPASDSLAMKPRTTTSTRARAPLSVDAQDSANALNEDAAVPPIKRPTAARFQSDQRTSSVGQSSTGVSLGSNGTGASRSKPADAVSRPVNARNPSKQNRPPTPSSAANKRQSAVMGGLGARTVSPTDARRLKRASEVWPPPLPPPIPAKSPTPDVYFGLNAGTNSPPLLRHRSRTPPSSRATPEVNHRLSSGRLSSRSSFSSLRPPSASQQRSSLLPPSTGAANVNTRNVHSSAGLVSETVPPVPAIPKAFESPTDTAKEPFFLSSMDSTTVSSQRTSTTSNTLLPETKNAKNSDAHETRQKRGATLGGHSSASKAPSTQDHTRKRVSQQPRLPPINLLPLSDPTTAKIQSLSHGTADLANKGATTPPQRNAAKTPSTPMTASRATFSSNELQFRSDSNRLPPLRTSISFATPSSDTSTPNDSDIGFSAHPLTASSTKSQTIASPVLLSSNSRGLLEPYSGATSAAQEENEAAEHAWSKEPRLNTSRLRLSSTASRDAIGSQPSPAKEGESSQPNSASIRRKMSFGWRRSSSKASHTSQPADDNKQKESSDASAMLPPRLPASAAWNNGSLRLTPTSLSSQRSSAHEADPLVKKSQGGSITEKATARTSARKVSQNGDVEKLHAREATSSAGKVSSSIFSPVQKMLGSRTTTTSSSRLQADESRLDRDDIVAEEEMKRLASKRKDFESAAKEMDELKRRATPKDALSPGQACHVADLNIFERGEIIDYKEIYFCGSRNTTKFAGDLASQASNFGFDDERGDYNIIMGDHLAYRYEMVDLLGKGSFGQVVRCIDHKTGKLVAIKIIRNKKRFHQQALVEVNILQRLRDWDPQGKHSMINFTQSFYFRGHLCISTELLGINLYEFIKAHDFHGFSLKLIRRFTKQLLGSLFLLQSRKVIHCDLKPENILLAHPLHSEIKVIDFGSSCFDNEKVYTYIQSRFYRSPEVILGMDYGMPIDMWSLGCILAELYTGYPIFPGENEQEQLACIMEVFGPPEKHLIEKSTRRKVFFDSLGKPRVTVSSKGKRRRPSSKTLQQALKCDDEAFVDFIAKCLRWDPERRLKPDDALSHDFVTGAKKQLRPKVSAVTSSNSSPAKRITTVASTPVRPLPETPATGFKSNLPINGRGPSSSPIKMSAVPRRHSVMNQGQGAVGVKRDSSGTAVAPVPGSALPKSTTRSASGKPDYASAAAIASLRQK